MLLHPPSDIIHLFLIGNFLGCGIVPGGEAAEEYERLQQKKEYKKEYQHKKPPFISYGFQYWHFFESYTWNWEKCFIAKQSTDIQNTLK